MQELQDFLRSDLDALNARIQESLKDTKVPLITEISQHLMNAGGKRLRPLLTSLCGHLCGTPDQNRTTRLGTCIEFIHTATLLHDDVIDESAERRGRPSAHTLWGNDASVLVGDFLFSRAFELMVQEEDIDVFRILSHTASKISEGELLQLTHCGTASLSVETCLDIIGSKTASLFSAACELGGLAAGASQETRKSLKSIGHILGVLYQIGDDMLDFGLTKGTLGKAPGNDLMEGKMTLPLILTYKTTSDENKRFIEHVVTHKDSSKEHLPKIQKLLEDHQSLEACLAYAAPLKKQALDQLSSFPESVAKNLFLKLLDFSLTRHWAA